MSVATFNNAQRSLIIKAMLGLLGAVQEIRLDEYLTDALCGVYVDLVERILAVRTVKAQEDFVATWLDGDGKPFGATLAQVKDRMTSGRVPATFVIQNRRLVRIAPFATLQEIDQVAGFRAEMTRRASIADEVPAADAAAS